jgi:hypothetical protein
LVVKNQNECLRTLQIEFSSLSCSLKTNELKDEIISIGNKLQSLEQKLNSGSMTIKKIDPKERFKLESEYSMNQKMNKDRKTTVVQLNSLIYLLGGKHFYRNS